MTNIFVKNLRLRAQHPDVVRAADGAGFLRDHRRRPTSRTTRSRASMPTELVERFRTDAIDNIQDDLRSHQVAGARAPPPSAPSSPTSIPTIARSGTSSASSSTATKIVSMYVGLADGSFRQARQHRSHGRGPGQAAAAGGRDSPIAGSTRRRAGRRRSTTTCSSMRNGRKLGKSEQVTAYDPRAPPVVPDDRSRPARRSSPTPTSLPPSA